jgi:hypothetical protein
MASTGPLLHDAAEVHHHHLARDLGDDSQIVGDEDDGRLVLPLELPHEVQHLRLRRHVDRGRRLVAMRRRGLQDSAMAIIARWRRPPESCHE